MAKRQNPPPRKPLRTLRDAEMEMFGIFAWIVHHYGLETARRVAANFAEEPTPKQREVRDQLELLDRLASMTPRPNVAKLARELLADEGIHEGDGRFANKHAALAAKIRSWKRHRPAIEAKFAPVSPPLRKDQPASFRLIDLKKRRK
jgi:hypothetical protein